MLELEPKVFPDDDPKLLLLDPKLLLLLTGSTLGCLVEGARELVTGEDEKVGLGARVEADVEADTGLAGAELLMSLTLTLTTGAGVLGLLVCWTVV